MHADRTNRAMMVVLALLLLAAGGVGIIASFGVLKPAYKHRTLLHNSVSHYIGHHGDLLWPAAAVVALVIVLLSLRWLLSLLFSTDRAHDLDVAGGGGTGKTTLNPAALNAAVVQEIEGLPGVDSAKARIIGAEDDPELVVTARLQQGVDLVAARHRIVDGPLRNARTAMDRADMPIQLDLLVSTKRADRVS
ncbi:MAG: alkaline shock response membrane anchor protein AmaP [Actinomycetota bacterium]